MFPHNQSVSIARISNGYIVSVPQTFNDDDEMFLKKRKVFEEMAANATGEKNEKPKEKPKADPLAKYFIPNKEGLIYFESIDKVFEFLKSIEKNVPEESGAFALAG